MEQKGKGHKEKSAYDLWPDANEYNPWRDLEDDGAAYTLAGYYDPSSEKGETDNENDESLLDDLDYKKFAKRLIGVLETRQSAGRPFTETEAMALYRAYQEHAAETASDQPLDSLGVISDLEDLLVEKKQEAELAHNQKAAAAFNEQLLMLSDLEVSESADKYYELAKGIPDRGGDIAMRRYIDAVIEKEGYCGSKEMRDYNIEGGIVRFERNLRILEMLNSAEGADAASTRPIGDIASEITNFLEEKRAQNEQDREASLARMGKYGQIAKLRGERMRREKKERARRARFKKEPIMAGYQHMNVLDNALRDDMTKNDWKFIERFSNRGKELHDLVDCFAKAEDYLLARGEIEKTIREKTTLCEEVESDNELSPSTQKMLDTAELGRHGIVDRIRGAIPAMRETIARLREEGRALEARRLERDADKLAEQAEAIEVGKSKVTDELREDFGREPVTRAELAKNLRAELDAETEKLDACDSRFERLVYAARRTKEEFSAQVLYSNIDWMPKAPKEVADYLYRKFGKDTLALDIIFGDPSTKNRFHIKRLTRLRYSARKDYFARENFALSMEGDNPNYIYDTRVGLADPTGGARGEAELIKNAVIPYLDSAIAALGGETKPDKAEIASRQMAELSEKRAKAAKMAAAIKEAQERRKNAPRDPWWQRLINNLDLAYDKFWTAIEGPYENGA